MPDAAADEDPRVEGWPPARNLMPVLEHLDSKNILNVVLNELVGDRGVPGMLGRQLSKHLARLTDKTILSYEAARTELDKYVDQSASGAFKLSPLIRAIDHFETTIDSLH